MDKASDKLDQRGLIFAAVAGFFFFITLLKWGNPVILDNQVSAPENIFEFLYQSWPVSWAYVCLIPVVLVGLISIQPPKLGASMPAWFRIVLTLPVAWLVWQFVSAIHTVDSSLTAATLKHFTICVVLFYLGFFSLGRLQNPWPVWLFLALALLWIVKVGFEQHFGGLEATRKYFYSLPAWREAPPEFIKKISSNRIYSTLFYPNTLAGALILVVPITLGFVWTSTSKLQAPSRWLIIVVITIPSLACLYWSQSKAGWLIALALVALALLNSNLPVPTKWTLLVSVVAIGSAAFLIRHAAFFERGATSVVARTDYWKAALSTGLHHPLFGTGPGTFAIPYAKIKAPDAEMARLAHDDFLQQFSDSGIVGFTAFVAFICAVLVFLYRYRNKRCGFVAFGLAGVILHETVEFHLYIPAIAWPLFLLSGWILRTSLSQPSNRPSL